MHNDLMDLIFEIENPRRFPENVHGPGYRVEVDKDNEVAIATKRILQGVFYKGKGTQYFVKELPVPLVLNSWKFDWSEGTSSIDITFTSFLEIHITNQQQALDLTKALNGAGGPAKRLYDLVRQRIHYEMTHLFQRCMTDNRNLMDEFRRSDVGIGESQALNDNVSNSVSDKLGTAYFGIGLQIENAPLTQVEVKKHTDFEIADSGDKRQVYTTALLELVSFQAYKKSGIQSEEELCIRVKSSIDAAVKRHLFGVNYYDIVRSFADANNSIESRMHDHIRKDALELGYDVKMFQAFPGIGALPLIDGLRIDINPNDNQCFTKHGKSAVNVGLSISISICDFDSIARLIKPDDGVKETIHNKVIQICKDAIRKKSGREFNLCFEKKVQPAIKNAVVKELGKNGLKAELINIYSEPTEEANRFDRLRGEATEFHVSIEPQAEEGDGDIVEYTGVIRVVGLDKSDDAWEKFENKNHAIEHTLMEIRDRVERVISSEFSTTEYLAAHTRSHKGKVDFKTLACTYAKQEVAREFGLQIELYGIKRNSTHSEKLYQELRIKQLKLTSEIADIDSDIERKRKLTLESGKLSELQSLIYERKELLDDSDEWNDVDTSERLTVINNRIKELGGGLDKPVVSSVSLQLGKTNKAAITKEKLAQLPSLQEQLLGNDQAIENNCDDT